MLEVDLEHWSYFKLHKGIFSGKGFPGGSGVMNVPAMQETRVQSLG